MSELTASQKKAVETTDRNVCVSAGAGTGKTRVLVERFIHLVEKGLARCDEILAITFTEKAAQEMKTRIAKRLRERGLEDARRELENAYIGTIHSFCARILREHPMEAGVDPHFRVLEEDQANLLKAAVLDELIEGRFQEPAVFDLLHVYSEEKMRQAIQSVVDRAHAFGSSVLEIAAPVPSPRDCFGPSGLAMTGEGSRGPHPRNDGEEDVIARQQAKAMPKQSPGKVLSALQALKGLMEKESDYAEIAAAIEKPVSHWGGIEGLREIGKKFRRQKTKPEIAAFKDALDEWTAFQMQSLGQTTSAAFLDLASDFETRYRKRKRERAALDFNDLERVAVHLMNGDEPRSVACRKLYQTRFKFVMVDEFQDTSPLQDRLISLVTGSDNLFVVGDWKQSIYGFRGADASLILEREKTFLAEGRGERFSLTENFRSCTELLKPLNHFFEQLWARENRVYEPLQPSRSVVDVGARFIAPSGAINGAPTHVSPPVNDYRIELLTIERLEDETVEEVRMNEARALAEQIRAWVESGTYEYGDIAMLFRVATDIYFYEHELKNLGIPYYVVSGRGFYKQPEVRDVITFLEFLENPHLDIPLASVLRSPFVQISDDTLFWLANASTRLKPKTPNDNSNLSPSPLPSPPIRERGKGEGVPPSGVRSIPLYDAFLKSRDILEIGKEDQAKLENFKRLYFELREQKSKCTISECLEHVLERTRYDRYVLGLPQGKRHFANLRRLLEIARELETQEPIHLGDFIRYVKGLETQEVRESEAQVEALEGNVVKLMTIHKAKGLEFRVVIIPDLNRKGEKRHMPFLIDPEYGLGFKVWNESTRKFEETLGYRKGKEKIVQNALEESKRLLYVGMTRAEDRLVLSGSSEEAEEEGEEGSFNDEANWYTWIRQWVDSRHGDGCVHKIIQRADERKVRVSSPLANHKKIRAALERHEPIRLRVPERAHQVIESLQPVTPVSFERIDLPVTAYSVFESSPETYRQVYELGALPNENLSRRTEAPHLILRPKAEEWSVDEDDSITCFRPGGPAFFEGSAVGGADFGTLIHRVFEYLVSHSERAKPKADEILKRMARGLEKQTVDEAKNLTTQFLSSHVFSEIKQARARYAEIPFVLRLRSGIVQGTLDLLYQSAGGEWIILDYKTDRVPERHDGGMAQHAEKYRTQMMFYALAAHELLQLPLKRTTLYFVRPNETFDFDLEKIDFGALRSYFEDLQKQIITQREAWLQ